MSALCEEAAICNYRCFSSLIENTTNKCSCVTWQRVSEKPFVCKLVCLCSWDHMTKAPYSVLSFFPSPPSFLGASSAFEVAMWKSLATNLNKYNNRVISSVTDALLFFFFSPRCRGGAVFCERRAWSRASLPLPFPGPFLFVDLHVFYGRPPPPSLRLSCGGGSVSHHGLWWNHKKAQAHVTRANSCLVTRKGVWGGGWACSEGSGPDVVTVQSADELFISSRTRIKCSYPHRSNVKLVLSF